MKVTQEGMYKSQDGTIYPVVNVNPPCFEPYFRAVYCGGYYNVNKEIDNFPFDEIEIEMVERIGDLI